MPVNLLFNALLTAIREAAEGRGLKSYRISHKRNDRGELVIALIISPEEPGLTPEKISG